MVGRLVEQQHVALGDQQGGQRDPAPLAAGQPLRREVEADPGEQLGHDHIVPPALGRGGRRTEKRRRFRVPSPLSPERVGPIALP